MDAGLSEADLDLIFRRARTANHYHDREVTPDLLQALWNIAKWGPTSANSMPARVVWCVSAEAKTRLAACASSANRPKVEAAPVTAIIGMDMAFHDQLPHLYPATNARSWFAGNEPLISETALRNSSLQAAYLIIAARALGLGTGPMSGFDNAAVDLAFFARTSIRSNLIMTLGYPDPDTYRPRGPRLTFEEATRIE